MSKFIFLFALPASTAAVGREQDALPALKDGIAPRNLWEMWSGCDPPVEPLEVEATREREKDGVVLRIVRFRIGVFKNQKAMLAGAYGFSKGTIKLPGLVQNHGDGQH